MVCRNGGALGAGHTGRVVEIPEIEVDDALVAALVAAQFPHLAGVPVRIVAAGWDNVIARVGDDVAARLPVRESAVPLLVNEQRWLPVLAPTLSVATPVPLGRGRRGETYPWPWSLVPWFAGPTALDRPPSVAAQGRFADELAVFLRGLHQPAPDDAPHNAFRGVPLAARDELARSHLAQLAAAGWTLSVAAETRWRQVVDAPAPTERRWLHGDTHPGNLMVDESGRLRAVLDWGDLCGGDVASDLVIAWMSLEPGPRRRLRAAIGVDDATWARGQGWALAIGLALMTSPRADARYRSLGERTVGAVLAEDPIA